jgi:hypothetical protein
VSTPATFERLWVLAVKLAFALVAAENEGETLFVRVAEYMCEHPTASANEVDRGVPGQRKRILRAYRTIRGLVDAEPVPPLSAVLSRFPPPDGGSRGAGQ